MVNNFLPVCTSYTSCVNGVNEIPEAIKEIDLFCNYADPKLNIENVK